MISYRRKFLAVSKSVVLLSLFQFNNYSFSQSGSSQSGFGISGATEYTENPLRLNDPQESDMLTLVSVDGNLARETQRFNVFLNYRASRNDYANNLLQDRNLVEGSSTVVWKVSPDVLQWSLTNSRTNEIISATQPDILDNRQIISSTSTGPSLSIPLGAANLLNLQANYSVAGYEQTGFLDQERKSVSADFSRILSRRIRASLKSNILETKFDTGAASKYRISSYSAIGTFTESTYSASLELGRFYTERTGTPDASNPLVRVSGSYQLNSSSEFRLNYFRTVEDLLSDIGSSQVRAATENETAPELDIDLADQLEFDSRLGSSDLAGVFVKDTSNVSYSYVDRSRFNLNLDYTKDKRDFQQSNELQTDEKYTASLMLPLSPSLNLTFRARYSELKLSVLTPVQERTELSISSLYRINDRLRLNFSFRNIDQESDSILDTYDGVNVFFGITYRR